MTKHCTKCQVVRPRTDFGAKGGRCQLCAQFYRWQYTAAKTGIHGPPLPPEYHKTRTSKICKVCNKTFPLTQFYAKGTSYDQKCRGCRTKYTQSRYADRDDPTLLTLVCTKCNVEKTKGDYYKNRLSPSGRSSFCKDCQKGLVKQQLESGYMTTHNWKKHGLGPEDYTEMFLAQGGRCAICGSRSPRRKNSTIFSVDHDHNHCSGSHGCRACVRALLCAKCNTGLGYFDDSPENLQNASRYLILYT